MIVTSNLSQSDKPLPSALKRYHNYDGYKYTDKTYIMTQVAEKVRM